MKAKILPRNETPDGFLAQLAEWQLTTFPGESVAGVLSHLREEIDELSDRPGDPDELADCLMLICCLCFHQGIDPIEAMRAKHAVNLQRTWQKTERGFRHA